MIALKLLKPLPKIQLDNKFIYKLARKSSLNDCLELFAININSPSELPKMKLSFTSVFTLSSLLAITAIAAPVAVASPEAIAVAEPKAIAVAEPLAEPVPFASPDALLNSLKPLEANNQGIANITRELTELTSLLTSSSLPKDTLTKLVTIVVDLLKDIVTTLGGVTGLEQGTDALNALLDDTFAKLDDLLANSGLDATLNKVLDSLIDALKTLLSKLLWTINQVLSNLLKLNLVGVIVALLSGSLASVDLFLSKIKNGVLPA